jgi:AraC-like DNA-binding protein
MSIVVKAAAPEPVASDSRGIIRPDRLALAVRLERFAPPPGLAGVVDRLWAAEWDVPSPSVHRQQVLTHPGANVTVGHPDARAEKGSAIEGAVQGVSRRLGERALAGRGWTVAALMAPGGIGAFIEGSARVLTDRSVALDVMPRLGGASLVRRCGRLDDQVGRSAALAAALEHAVLPHRLSGAQQVSEAAVFARTDRSVRRVKDLASGVGVSARTLQRAFMTYAGVSPTWTVRRYRLLDVFAAVHGGERPDWASVAAVLGYADQAHLVRDFRAATGWTPAAYARALAAKG